MKFLIIMFLYLTIFLTVLLLPFIGLCDGAFFGADNNIFTGSLAITMFLNILLQVFVYTICVIVDIFDIVTIKSKREKLYFNRILLYFIAVLLSFSWYFITKWVANNGHCDIIWGPADSGLIFIGFSSIVVNYMYLRIINKPMKI
jgi:hypothetical protein